jgi:UTP--glucose-1-phosphate uridylyltransferase
MIIKSKVSCTAVMNEVYHKRSGGNVIAVETVLPHEVSRYGVVADRDWQDNHFAIHDMVEKPSPENAPSNLIISGRYILQPEIFDILADQTTGVGGEVQLTDAMLKLLAQQDFHGVKFAGKTFDCGSKEGFLAANIAFALERPDMAATTESMLKNALAELGYNVEKLNRA